MLKSFRDSLLTTTIAMAPFLLTACGGDGTDNGKQNFEIVVLPLLFMTVSLISNLSKSRKQVVAAAA